MKQNSLLFLGFFLLLFIACQPSEPQGGTVVSNGECPAGKPAAMFSDTMMFVEKHDIIIDGQEAEEKVVLKGGTKVMLSQGGCEKIRQEFQITHPGDFSKLGYQDWIILCVSSLDHVASASPALGGLRQWSGALKNLGLENLKLGEPIIPDPSVTVKLDKIISDGEATVIIVFQQN